MHIILVSLSPASQPAVQFHSLRYFALILCTIFHAFICFRLILFLHFISFCPYKLHITRSLYIFQCTAIHVVCHCILINIYRFKNRTEINRLKTKPSSSRLLSSVYSCTVNIVIKLYFFVIYWKILVIFCLQYCANFFSCIRMTVLYCLQSCIV